MTAIAASLELLDIKGHIVTIDITGCQKVIARQIIEQCSDYALGESKPKTVL